MCPLKEWPQHTLKTLENTEGAIKTGQSRETGKHKVHTRRKKHNTICVGHHYTQTITNNINRTWTLLQITGSKDEPNIVLIRK